MADVLGAGARTQPAFFLSSMAKGGFVWREFLRWFFVQDVVRTMSPRPFFLSATAEECPLGISGLCGPFDTIVVRTVSVPSLFGRYRVLA